MVNGKSTVIAANAEISLSYWPNPRTKSTFLKEKKQNQLSNYVIENVFSDKTMNKWSAIFCSTFHSLQFNSSAETLISHTGSAILGVKLEFHAKFST